VKLSHGELVTKVKKRDSELVTCDEFTGTPIHSPLFATAAARLVSKDSIFNKPIFDTIRYGKICRYRYRFRLSKQHYFK